MNTKTKRLGLIGAALLTTTALLGSALPATAAEYSVTASKTVKLKAAGDVVNVTVANLPANSGVYIRLCKATAEEAAKARPQVCADMRSTKWVTTSAMAVGQGATLISDAPIALAVSASFVSGELAVNCLVDACGIHVRRDHLGGATDFSLDRFIAVSFAPAKAKNAVSFADSKVSITVVNQKGKRISFVVGDKRFTRTAKTKSFTFTTKAPDAATFRAAAFVGSKKLVSKKLTK